MIIPLGMGQSLQRKPYATITIVLVNLFFFLFQPDFRHLYRKTAEIRRELGLKEKSVYLFENYCHIIPKINDLCDEYSFLIANQYLDSSTMKQERLEENRREMQREQRLTKKLIAAKKGQTLFKLIRVIHVFMAFRFLPEKRFKNIEGYAEYDRALRRYNIQVTREQMKYRALSKLNHGGSALVIAQMSHSGWMHLLSNMFFLVVFGIYVEQRLRGLKYMMLYWIGGSLALLCQVLCFQDPTVVLLGASANVCTILGVFYALFYDFAMRVYIPFTSTKTKIWLPVKYALPILFVASDVVGVFGERNAIFGGTGVAHFAHLVGFFIGAILGFSYSATNKLPQSFLYDYELSDFKIFRKEKIIEKKLSLAKEILSYNRENHLVQQFITENSQFWQERNRVSSADMARRGCAFLIDIAFFLALVALAQVAVLGLLQLAEGVSYRETLAIKIALRVLIFILYMCYPLLKEGQTVGKKALQIKFVFNVQKKEIPLFRIILRETVGKLLFILTGGFFFCLLDPRMRAVHDRLFGTSVVTELLEDK